MSRFDLTGLFWDDYKPPRVAVIKEKKVPPNPVWLADDYLPNYEEACAFVPDLMSDAELMTAKANGHRFIWDTEYYPNYALIGFRDTVTKKILSFEQYMGFGLEQPDKLRWILQNFTVVGFNDTKFDVPMAMASLSGFNTDELFQCVEHLIKGEDGTGTTPKKFYTDKRVVPFYVNNIDLIELTPLGPGLKTCAGRLHAPRMADLPFQVGKILSPEQITILRWYWTNDLQNTDLLYGAHKTAIGLRELLTKEYNVDVRSKSDPQIAEQVIRTEIMRMSNKKYIQRAKIEAWRSFRFVPPTYLQYRSSIMQWVLEFVRIQDFIIDDKGSPTMPEALSGLDVKIGASTYRMGIGGLHSQEKRAIHIAGDEFEITDSDVTSYYPSLMISQGMYPPNVGPEFLTVFKGIVTKRVAAKRAGDKGTAETLKIVANGTFGKTLERGGYSVVYYPDMGIQVTISGQLSLLMLIEWLELAGIPVISANTDGIIVKCPVALKPVRDEIMAEWEKVTGLGLEHKIYKSVYSRDVNNYLAFYTKPDEKEKSVFKYCKAVGAYRQTLDVYPLKWNPTCEICTEAVIEWLANGRPIEETIRACTDVRKFIQVRMVHGSGACKDGEYLGKAIRWYYSTEVTGEIINAKNGHTISLTEGARPCLTLPTKLPDDINWAYYTERAFGILDDFQPKQKAARKTVAA